MKRTYLYFIAVFFICAIASAVSAIQPPTKRTAQPTFSQRYEWQMRGKTLPRLPNPKAFFHQFAP
jgi:hypothetical protein